MARGTRKDVPRPVQLGCAITEELLDQLKVLAAMDQVTYSYKAYQIIQQYADEHKDQIQQYKNFMKNLKR